MGMKNENFQKKCRLCGRLGRRFTDIFSTQLPSAESKPNRKLSQLIYKYLQLQVKEDDSLPKKICDDCNKKLASWQNFYKKCEQTQKRLQQYLENWLKSSVCVLSSKESDVACLNGEVLSQVSLKNGLAAETTQTKTCELPKKVKDISAANLKTKNDIPVIHKGSQDEHKSNKNISNVNKGGDKPQVKVKKPAARRKTDIVTASTEDTHVVTISKENQLEKQEVHQCHICEKSFPSRGKLNTHVAAHLSIPEFQCDKCSKKFRSKFSLRSHLETHSENRNYCCHHCGRLFHTGSGLCNHVRLHSEETKRFSCPLCGKLFRQAGHLEQHQRTHTGERPHQCIECEQRFTTRCQLNRHVQGVHRCAKKHKCPICGKEFLYSTNFKAHLLRHAGERNNKCGECGKTFVTSNALFRHRRSHTGDKPFQCDICGKKFADCSNRKRHMLRHLQQPVIPRGRKSGPRPKLARIINLKNSAPDLQEQPSSCKQVQMFDGQDGNKAYSQLIEVSASSVGGNEGDGNGNVNSSQSIEISGEVVQLCSNNSVELGNLTSVCASQLSQQLNVSSTNNQLSSYNNLVTDSSDIYVSLLQDTHQFIQLSSQNTNLLIQPMAQDITQLVQSGDTERQYVDQLDSSLKEKLVNSANKHKHTTKVNGSTSYTTNVIQLEESVQQRGNISVDRADKSKLYQSQEDNRDIEVDKPKTYANLRTFLESSEVVETLSGSRNDDVGDGDNGLVNVEYVTLMADDGHEVNFTSGIQEIIVLPHETRISDYDLSKNGGKFRMVVQGNEESTDRKTTGTEQDRKENAESVTVLTETQNINSVSHLPLITGNGKVMQHVLQTSNTNCDNLIEVFLSNIDGSKLSKTNSEEENSKIHTEPLDSSNLIQVLLETDGNNTTAQQEDVDKTRQTFLVSSDSFGDEDAIIRMLNSQGTVMLPTTRTDFDLTESPIAEVSHLIEGSNEKGGMVMSEHQAHSVLNFKSFSNVDDTGMCETDGKKRENNGNIDLISSSDYGHEISLKTAILLDNSDVSSMVRKGMSVKEELEDRMQPGDLKASDQNEIPSGCMDDIEMFELCTEEDLTKLAPIYQVYQSGKSVENV